MNDEYSIENDDYYKTYMSNPERGERTAKRHKTIIGKLYEATGLTIGEIIQTCIDEQTIVTRIKLPPPQTKMEMNVLKS